MRNDSNILIVFPWRFGFIYMTLAIVKEKTFRETFGYSRVLDGLDYVLSAPIWQSARPLSN